MLKETSPSKWEDRSPGARESREDLLPYTAASQATSSGQLQQRGRSMQALPSMKLFWESSGHHNARPTDGKLESWLRFQYPQSFEKRSFLQDSCHVHLKLYAGAGSYEDLLWHKSLICFKVFAKYSVFVIVFSHEEIIILWVFHWPNKKHMWLKGSQVMGNLHPQHWDPWSASSQVRPLCFPLILQLCSKWLQQALKGSTT